MLKYYIPIYYGLVNNVNNKIYKKIYSMLFIELYPLTRVKTHVYACI